MRLISKYRLVKFGVLQEAQYIANNVRSKLEQAYDASSYSILMQILSELQQGKLFQTNNQTRSFVSLQMLYKKLAAPLKICQFDLLNGSNSADPIANMFPQCKRGKVSPDLYFISQSLEYIESRIQHNAQDKLFEKVFWQLIRIQSQLHRHTVQRPLTPGLQWFLRFYSHSSPIRKVFNTRDNVISSTITSGLGRGLKSLELRTSPFTSNSELLTFIIDVEEAAEEIQKKIKNEQPLELGIVFHFIKQRGGNAEKGEPIAHGKNSNADPVVDSVFTETVTNGNPQGYRFSSFYLKKKQEALSLIWLLKHHPNALQIVRGLDVCTDELAVPNWVLAPIVNEVRQQSIYSTPKSQDRYFNNPYSKILGSFILLIID